MHKSRVSIVIPTYNEIDNIPIMMRAIEESLDSKWNYEIIIVDDASPDGTGAIVRELAKADDRINLIERSGKLGLGSAVVAGFDYSKGDYLVMMDADMSHDPKYLPNLLLALEDYDVVIGSRYVEGGGVDNWPLWRRVISRVASSVGRLIVGLDVRDLTSGFGAFKRDHIIHLLPSLSPKGFKLLLEIIAKSPNVSIKECPIIFTDREFGQSKASFHEILLFIKLCFQLRASKTFHRSH
jgi:dolichol-phosphate mannosyltransferase